MNRSCRIWKLALPAASLLCVACQGPVRLAEHWEVGELGADADYVFGATLDGIRRVGRDGSGEALLVPYRTGVFAESNYRPGRIAVEETYVYWTQRDAVAGIPAVRRVRKTGGVAETVLTVNGDAWTGPMFLCVDANSVYVLTYGRGRLGNPVTDTAAGYAGGSLVRVSKRDGAVSELAAGIRAGSGLAFDQDFVYWSEVGTYRASTTGPADYIYNMDGKILRVRKTGGAVKTVATGLDNPADLRTDDGRLQFRAGAHYARNRRTEDLGFFELAPGGRAQKIAPRPFFAQNGFRYALVIEPYGPEGTYGRRAHYTIEREEPGGATGRVYTTDEDITAFIVDRDEVFWLQGTDYALMKLSLARTSGREDASPITRSHPPRNTQAPASASRRKTRLPPR